MISAHDGRLLPAVITPLTLAYLASRRKSGLRPPDWFMELPVTERRRVLNHMNARNMGPSAPEHQPPVGRVHFRYAPDPQCQVLFRKFFAGEFVAPDAPPNPFVYEPPNPFVYEPPNGGNRVLPSVYATLTDKWVTNKGEVKAPVDMTTGHLNNTVKLVRESHKNVSGKINELLGRAGNHLRNVPHLVEKLEEIAREVEELDIEDVYPIWGPLTEELATRHPTERAFVEMHPNKPGLPLREGFLRTTARLDPEDSNYGGF